MSAWRELVPAPESDGSCRLPATLPATALLGSAFLVMTLAACGDGSSAPTEGPSEGTLEVAAVTTGDTLDTDGYAVTLDGTDPRMLSSDGSVTFDDVPEGSHEVEVSGVQVNCEPVNGSTRNVSVTAGDVTQVQFDVSCRPALLDRILFTSYRDDGDADLYAMALDGSQEQRLMDTPDRDVHPAWSPDGSRIGFTSERSGNGDVFSMDLDGSNLERLTDASAFDGQPGWSPTR